MSKLKYSVGDKFKLRGTTLEVKFINNGKAWLFPLYDTTVKLGRVDYSCCAVAKLDDEGFDESGERAFAVKNKQSLAV